jgi:hypothetical protein
MYAAIYDMQESKQNELKAMLYENITALTRQVELLPLKSGNTEQVVEQLKRIVTK